MNVLEMLDLGQIRTTQLKTGEILVGVTYNVDEGFCYIDFPYLINFIKGNEYHLTPYMYFTTAKGLLIDFNDTYYSEAASGDLSTIYLKYIKHG